VSVDLSHPLRTIVPSLDADVLEVLAGVETGLGLSQITRLAARGSRMGVSHVVSRLVEHGLVLAQPANHGSLYRLNRDHVLAPVVLAGVSARSSFLALLGQRVHDLAPSPSHVSIVGSFARGEAGVASDVDLLVVVPSDADLDKLDDQLENLADAVLAWTGNRVQLLAFTLSHLRRLCASEESMVEAWCEDAHLLAGSDLPSLLRDLRRRPGSRSRGPSRPRR